MRKLTTSELVAMVVIAAVFLIMMVRLPEVKEPTREQLTGPAKHQGWEYVKRVEGR